jgi:hypothetical protein
LRKIAKEKAYKALYHMAGNDKLEDDLKSVTRELFQQLRILQNQLMLEPRELLTTLILLLVDKKENKGIVLVVGDGVVCINGKTTEFDHDNKPDYLGFHLNEDFETWYVNQKQTIAFDKVEDISIATDGIGMFERVKQVNAKETIDPMPFLLLDNAQQDKEDMLDLKLKQLEHHYGLKPTDDLAMIRIIKQRV